MWSIPCSYLQAFSLFPDSNPLESKGFVLRVFAAHTTIGSEAFHRKG